MKFGQVIIIYALSLMTLFSCNNSTKVKSVKEDSDEYSNILRFFGDSLVNHFPKEEPTKINMAQHVDTFCYHNTLSFQLTLYDAKKIIDSTLNHYSKQPIIQYKSNDICLIVVNDYITKYNCGDYFRAEKSTYFNGCSNSKLPIPNFWSSELASCETRSRLPKDFILYVIDSKIGLFSKKINAEQSSLPIHIKHGYSKGLAINKEKNIINYWVIVW